MFRRIAVAVGAPALLLLSMPHALAATGHVTDPTGDAPDITRLNYDNAKGKVVMTLKFADVTLAQARSFYIQWGKPKKYQVFDSPSAGSPVLRFGGTEVACDNLKVTEDAATNTVKAVVPRGCLPKAPDKVKFKGIATMGLSLSDETAVSPWVKRG